MLILLQSWKQSFQLLYPSILFGIIKQLTIRMVKAVSDVFAILKWVIVADAAIFLIFGKKFALALEQISMQPTSNMPYSVAFLSIIVSISLFLMQGSFLIFVRRPQHNQGYTLKEYFRMYFMRYVQLALFFSLIFILFISFLIGLGITKIPGFHWSAVFFLRLIELLMFFYWLDSGFSLKEMFFACECGLNFFFYNLPILLTIFMVFLFGWNIITFGLHHFPLDNFSLSSNHTINEVLLSIATVIVRYCKIFLEFVWISFLFIIYQRRKQISYNKSLFEESSK